MARRHTDTDRQTKNGAYRIQTHKTVVLRARPAHERSAPPHHHHHHLFEPVPNNTTVTVTQSSIPYFEWSNTNVTVQSVHADRRICRPVGQRTTDNGSYIYLSVVSMQVHTEGIT